MTTIEKKFVDLVDVIMDEIPEHLWVKLDTEDIIWDEDIPSPKYHVLSEWQGVKTRRFRYKIDINQTQSFPQFFSYLWKTLLFFRITVGISDLGEC